MTHSAGLFDLQVNGYAGVDFNDPAVTPADMDAAFEMLRSDGVTGLLPTIITGTRDQLADRFRALDAAVRGSRLGADMVPGYHLEGPFLNDLPGYHGCHDPSAMTDPIPELVALLEQGLSRPILLTTLAPERAGAEQAIKALKAAGKTVAIGHSAAGYRAVRAAAQAGATMSTHLGNGLPQELPKLENTLLAQLSQPELVACLIADGFHMSPEALGALIRIKGADNCVLVSDAVLAAGADPGKHRFAGMEIVLDDAGRVARPDQPGLAGSALRLDQAVRNVVGWQIVAAEQAMRMAGDSARAAIAGSLAHYGIRLDPGEVRWDSGLMPGVTRSGAITR